MALLVGLGNPGPRYQGTRHNAGFLVLDELFRRWGVDPSADKVAIRGRAGDHRLLKPLTFMNLSGRAVQGEMTRHGVSPDDLLVVHDDLDLPLGRLRLKHGGGAGGQKGVRDIAERIGPDFVRVKVGIGRPPDRWTVENWVLSRFRPEERELVDAVVAVAADAVERVLAEGLEAAMNAFNGVDLRAEESNGASAVATAAPERRDAGTSSTSEAGRSGDDVTESDAQQADSEDQPNRPEM